MRSVLFANDYPRALAEYKELQSWADEKGDKQLGFAFQLDQYKLTFDKDKTDENFEKDILELVKDAEANNFKFLKAEALEQLAEYHWKAKNYAAALENYINAYECYSGFTAQEFPHKADFLSQFGGKYYHFRDFRTAKKYFLDALKSIPPNKMSSNISKINTLALCYGFLEEYDSASFYLHKAMDYAVASNSEAWIGFISGNLGNIYKKQNNLDAAIPLFEKNIELDRKHNAKVDLAVSLSEYGAILLSKNEFEKDLQIQKEVLGIIEQKKLYNVTEIISRIYPNVAKAYAANGNIALAYRYLDSANFAKEAEEKSKSAILLSGVQHKIDIEKHISELQKKEAELKHQKLYRNSLLVGFAMLLLLVFFVLKNLSNQKKSNIIISAEKLKSEMLLLNILPAEVAEELKQSGMSEAKQYDNVSVLFTDFVGFTNVSEKLTPKELVAEVHHCFTAFDAIIERNGLEKIKTIGDAYLAVCGMPNEDKEHAKKTVQTALEIMDFVNKREVEGGYFKMRIGINSGPVVAGIVGIKKFAYDIWGDTVNTAARMEQNGENGKVNISGSTYELVKSDFKFVYRGKIAAKNKGEVDMYFVERS